MQSGRATLGERIRAIRGEMHQAEFGKLLGVSQGTVSAWERNDKDRPPSADMYFRLAGLASRPEDQAFFLQKAGLTGDIILSAAERIFADRSAPPSKSEIFRVPIVRRTPNGTEDTGELFPVAAWLVEHEASTVCFLVDDNSASPAVPSGDLILLDTSQCGAKDLDPFLGQVGLLDLGPPEKTVLHGTGYHGLCMGRLRRRVLSDDLGGTLQFPFYNAVATLLPFGAPRPRLEGGITELVIGRADSPPRIPTTAEEEAAFRAEVRGQAISLSPPLKVLGRVIGWFRPPKQGK
jgi:transcriptional regulator with XRE-family HTH domain